MLDLTLNETRKAIVQNTYESLDFEKYGWKIADSGSVKWDAYGELDVENNTIDFIGTDYAEPTSTDDDNSGAEGDELASTKISIHIILSADTNELMTAFAYDCDSGEIAATQESDKTVKVAVACTDSNGAPTIYIVTISVSQEQYALGEHCDLAEVAAAEDGYEGPFICFDDTEVHSIINAAKLLQA